MKDKMEVINKFNKVFNTDLTLEDIDDTLLLKLLCISNYYSTRSGDSMIFPKKLEGLREEVLQELINKSDRDRVQNKIKKLLDKISHAIV